MVTNFFTFGPKQQLYTEHYVKITAESERRCREIMIKKYGYSWAHQYDNEERAKVNEYKCKLCEEIYELES